MCNGCTFAGQSAIATVCVVVSLQTGFVITMRCCGRFFAAVVVLWAAGITIAGLAFSYQRTALFSVRVGVGMAQSVTLSWNS